MLVLGRRRERARVAVIPLINLKWSFAKSMTAGHEPRASHGPNETRDREGTDDERGGEPRRARDELDKTRHQNRSQPRSTTNCLRDVFNESCRTNRDRSQKPALPALSNHLRAKTLSARRDCNHCSNARCIVHHLCVTPPCRWSQTRKCIRADKRTASECSQSQQAREKYATNRSNNNVSYLGRDARAKPQDGIQ